MTLPTVQFRESGGGRGRGLFAEQAIRCGDKVMEEEAQYAQNDSDHVLACDRCLAFVGPLAAQLGALATASGIPLDYDATVAPLGELKLAPAVPCSESGCNTVFCSAACRDAALQDYHAAICAPRLPSDEAREALAWLSSHPSRKILLLGIVLQIVGAVAARSSNAEDVKKALEDIIGQYHHTSITKLKLGAMGVSDIPEACTEFQGATLVPAVAKLKTVFAAKPHVADAITLEWLDNVIGMCSVNGRRVRIFSPCQAMLDHVSNPVTAAQMAMHPPTDEARRRFTVWAAVVARKLGLDGMPDVQGAGLMAKYSMMNHNCSPNIGPERIDPETGRRRPGEGIHAARGTVYALRDIAAGEELFSCYIDPSLPVDERRGMLKNGYGFDCLCATCVGEMGSSTS